MVIDTGLTRVVHVRDGRYDVYVGRPSPWSNPFTHLATKYDYIKVKDLEGEAHFVPIVICGSREEAVAEYKKWILGQGGLLASIPGYIRGRTLGCFCREQRDGDGNALCHAVVLADIADGRWP